MSNFQSEAEQMAYAMGMNMGEYVAQMAVELDGAQIAAGLADYLAGSPKLAPEAYRAAMEQLQQRMKAAGERESAALGQANREEEAGFMAENAREEGVETTASGLQYRVVEEGSGARPAINDKVRVHYQGSLLNGEVFDSSIARGEPLELMLTQVIPGWTEGLQLMPVGSKYRFFIPSKLGYGERGAGQAIPPCAALIFDVELLAIVE
ncbi:FKBP-type 22 kDa peptidyl-prolyl cis-trans isomerase [bioreactor metagenome]|uniref:peptidylprolyl isomerase n=1 Tax=bioreactor metagenome TaxID=1076179 RepID=A0A645H6H4_9ZZZZ